MNVRRFVMMALAGLLLGLCCAAPAFAGVSVEPGAVVWSRLYEPDVVDLSVHGGYRGGDRLSVGSYDTSETVSLSAGCDGYSWPVEPGLYLVESVSTGVPRLSAVSVPAESSGSVSIEGTPTVAVSSVGSMGADYLQVLATAGVMLAGFSVVGVFIRD